MSTNLPEQQPSDEIDLGQLFKLIGNAFDRFFRFIGSIFNKLFLVFVWFVFFTKKHIVKVLIAGLIGFGLGFIKHKIEKPTYNSAIVVQQNLNTGEHLSNIINYYNALLAQSDSIVVGNTIGISPTLAAKITGLKMESNISENQKLQMFDNYLQTLDSTIASDVNYKDFIENTKDYNYKIQKLTLITNSKGNFSNVLLKILKEIEENDYYNELKLRRIDNLDRKDSVINKALMESEKILKIYKEILLREEIKEMPSGGTTNIAIGSGQEEKNTKELEIYNKDIELRGQLVENEAERRSLKNTFELISNPNGEAVLENNASLFGVKTSWMIALSIKITLLLYLILLLLEFLKFLERYKDKI